MAGKLFLVLITTALINNVVLSQFLGICPFLGVSKSTKSAAGMGGAVIFVITISSLVSSLLYKFVIEKLQIEYLETIIFIIVIAFLVQLVEVFLKKIAPALYKSLGVYLPLITTNCAVLGVALLNVNLAHNLTESVIYGFGASLGFALVLVLFAALRERLVAADVPITFRGSSIALITAGLMSLAFMGFAGLVK